MHRQVGSYYKAGLLSKTEMVSYLLAKKFPCILGNLFKLRKSQNGIIDGSNDMNNVIAESFDELQSAVDAMIKEISQM